MEDGGKIYDKIFIAIERRDVVSVLRSPKGIVEVGIEQRRRPMGFASGY